VEKSNGTEYVLRLPEGDDRLLQAGDVISVTGDRDGHSVDVDKWDLLSGPTAAGVGVLGASTPAAAPVAPQPITPMGFTDCAHGSPGCWKNACDFNDKDCYSDHKPS